MSFDSIPTPVLILLGLAIVLSAVDQFVWMSLPVKMLIHLLTLAVFIGGILWFLRVVGDGKLFAAAAGFVVVLAVPGLFIYYRRMLTQSRQVREYRARAEAARVSGDLETAALHEQTADSIRKTLCRIRL
jgi:hypothetical protein